VKEVAVNTHGSWISYGGGAEIVLAVALAAVAAAVAYAGFRLPLPAAPRRPGRTAKIVMIVIWVLAILALLVSSTAYIVQVSRAGLIRPPRTDPITPITVTGDLIVFIAILRMQEAKGWRVALLSAFVGAAAAPFIFELPFDLIIMARTHPVIDPGVYRLLLFGTLILVDITTLALLWLSPALRLRRSTLWCLAAMVAVFAGWSLLGFGYPNAAGPIAMNALSKVIALGAAVTLFLPERVEAETPERALARVDAIW
jgi:hypothetical protein